MFIEVTNFKGQKNFFNTNDICAVAPVTKTKEEVMATVETQTDGFMEELNTLKDKGVITEDFYNERVSSFKEGINEEIEILSVCNAELAVNGINNRFYVQETYDQIKEALTNAQ